MRALRRLRKEAPHADFVFVSERGSPSPSGFAKLVERAGEAAGLGFKAHPHMLRHPATAGWYDSPAPPRSPAPLC
jgi:integrase